MNDSETIALLREIRDLLAGQERVLEQHCARIREMNEHYIDRAEAQYVRLNRRHTITSYLYLFVVVLIGAAVGAHWGR